MKKRKNLYLLIVVIIYLSACSGNQETVEGAGPDLSIQSTTIPSLTPEPTLTFTPAPTFTPSVTPIVILDPRPLAVKFEAEDGVELEGLYYPAAENPAPLIVLVSRACLSLTTRSSARNGPENGLSMNASARFIPASSSALVNVLLASPHLISAV